MSVSELDRLAAQIVKDGARWFGVPPAAEVRQGTALRRNAEAADQLRTVRLCDVSPGLVQWLWPGRIPLGQLTLLCGDSGLGKSFLALDLAARASRGLPFPDQGEASQPSGTVILFSADGAAGNVSQVVRPRLDEADADATHIIAVEGVRFADEAQTDIFTRGFSLDTDLAALTDLLEGHPDAVLVVIDPISAYCRTGSHKTGSHKTGSHKTGSRKTGSRKTGAHKNAEIGSTLVRLAETAARFQVAIVGVTHLPLTVGDRRGHPPRHSLAVPAAAGAVWFVAEDRDDPERRLLIPVKLNLWPEKTGMAYRIADGHIEWEAQPVPITAADALAAEPEPRHVDATELRRAVQWLGELLAAGALPAREVKHQAWDCGFSTATLRRAMRAVGIKPTKAGFEKGGRWMWGLAEA
jgi:putative DNA primase/helicase